jgi:ubiquinone/menaquinone biosynthesis C-methylase UbiE
MPNEIRDIRKRLQQFKSLGYDLPASRRLLVALSGVTGGNVLEVGSGKGNLTLELAKKKIKVTSIDNDAKQLSVARMYLRSHGLSKYASFKKMSAQKIRYKNGSFDSVISIDFFHHAKSPMRCLKEIIRVTKRTVSIADLNKKGLRLMDEVHKQEGRSHDPSSFTFASLRYELKKQGFRVKSYRKAFHTYLIAHRRGHANETRNNYYAD